MIINYKNLKNKFHRHWRANSKTILMKLNYCLSKHKNQAAHKYLTKFKDNIQNLLLKMNVHLIAILLVNIKNKFKKQIKISKIYLRMKMNMTIKKIFRMNKALSITKILKILNFKRNKILMKISKFFKRKQKIHFNLKILFFMLLL